jgi:hypothetical protein
VKKAKPFEISKRVVVEAMAHFLSFLNRQIDSNFSLDYPNGLGVLFDRCYSSQSSKPNNKTSNLPRRKMRRWGNQKMIM